jgi:putative nucleotidyltransferase with HDIG domain
VPGSLSHLTARFFDVLLAKPLDAEEIQVVRTWLRPTEAEVFFDQADPDQRHGYHAATVVIGAGVADVVVIRAALLHDVGKRHARLGVIGRSLVSVLIRLGLPLPERGRLYRDHGLIGASELSRLGCEPLIVDFAREHHGKRPASLPEATWDILQAADQPPKPGSKVRA